MATINVYKQYFEADCTFNQVRRNGALVALISDSENGTIRYEAAVSFFPHEDPEDFAVSYDAYFSKVLYQGNGRRSKKRENEFLKPESFHKVIDELAEETGGKVYWDKPLGEESRG